MEHACRGSSRGKLLDTHAQGSCCLLTYRSAPVCRPAVATSSQVVDARTGQVSDPDVDVEWDGPPHADSVQGPAGGGKVLGWRRRGVLALPSAVQEVGAVLVRKEAAEGSIEEALDFINKVALKRCVGGWGAVRRRVTRQYVAGQPARLRTASLPAYSLALCGA